MFPLGDLEYKVTIDTKELKKMDKVDTSMEKGSKSADKFGKSASAAGGLFKAAFVAVVVAGALKVGKHLIKMASEAEEISNKFKVTFSDVRAEADLAAKNLAKNYGLSGKEAKKLLSNTGDLLTGFGLTADTALNLSEKTNQLAVDLASFTNAQGGAEAVSAALTSAYTGEREALKSYGIVISEAMLKEQLLEDAKNGLTFASEAEAKSFATLTLATEQSKNAIGDFSRSQDSLANQTRIAKAGIEDLSVSAGQVLLPVAGVAVKMFNQLTAEMSESVDGFKDFIGQEQNAKKLGDAIGFISGYLTTIKNIGTKYIKDIVTAFKSFLGPLFILKGDMKVVNIAIKLASTWFNILGGVLKIAGSYLGGLVKMYIQFGSSIFEVIKSLKNFQTVWEGIQEKDPKKVAEGFKEMGKVGFDEIKKSLSSVGDVFIDTKNTAVQAGKDIIGVWSGQGDKLVKEFASAEEEASEAVYNGLKTRNDAIAEALKETTSLKEDEVKTEGELEEAKTNKIKEELALRLAAIKENLEKVSGFIETFGGGAITLASSISSIQDNITQTRINNEQRALEVNKQTWDEEAEAKKAALNQELLGEEAYQSAITKIDEDNKKIQLEAEWRYTQAKYQAEKDAFERKKALAFAEIAINSSVGIIRAFAENYWPVAIGISAAITAQGIAQAVAVGTQPPPVAPVKPAFAEGGIVHNPGSGIDAIVGEGPDPEAILPLNDDTLSTLASAIVDAQTGTTSPGAGGAGKVINIIIEGLGKASIALTQEALNNRVIRVPATALVG